MLSRECVGHGVFDNYVDPVRQLKESNLLMLFFIRKLVQNPLFLLCTNTSY